MSRPRFTHQEEEVDSLQVLAEQATAPTTSIEPSWEQELNEVQAQLHKEIGPVEVKNSRSPETPSQRYYRKHRDKVLAKKRQKVSLAQAKWREYRSSAKYRELTFTLTVQDFVDLWQRPCYYCGDPIDKIGLDRVDNAVGYVRENVEPCCTACNKAKRTSSMQDYIERCQKVVRLHPE